ncbi:hypothetical protein U1Q18_039690 [Sarracenia purpurea var. burkii]
MGSKQFMALNGVRGISDIHGLKHRDGVGGEVNSLGYIWPFVVGMTNRSVIHYPIRRSETLGLYHRTYRGDRCLGIASSLGYHVTVKGIEDASEVCMEVHNGTEWQQGDSRATVTQLLEGEITCSYEARSLDDSLLSDDIDLFEALWQRNKLISTLFLILQPSMVYHSP